MSYQMENMYDNVSKEDKMEPRPYPNESKINIKIPTRILLLGPSGSGKTNLLLNLIKGINSFDQIVLLAADLEEPLYKHLAKTYKAIEAKLKMRMFMAIDNVDDLPALDDFDPKLNNLLIIDDMITANKTVLDKIATYWTRGRKKYVTTIFLSQSYYRVPKLIRQNSQYIMIKKIDTPKDLRVLLKEYPLGGIPDDVLKKLYNYAIDKGDHHLSFFMLDCTTQDVGLRFRANFDRILPENWKVGMPI
jgi:predicted AAA+ superfamily ATPase